MVGFGFCMKTNLWVRLDSAFYLDLNLVGLIPHLAVFLWFIES